MGAISCEREGAAPCLEGPLGEATLVAARELAWLWTPLESQILDNLGRIEYDIEIGGRSISCRTHSCKTVTPPDDKSLYKGENGVNRELRLVVDFQSDSGRYPFGFQRAALTFAVNGTFSLRSFDVYHDCSGDNNGVLRTRLEQENGRLMRAKQGVLPDKYFPGSGTDRQGFAFSFRKHPVQNEITGYYTIYGATNTQGQIIRSTKLGALATSKCLEKIVKFQPALPLG